MTNPYDELANHTDDFQFKINNTITYYQKEFQLPFHVVAGVLSEVLKDFLDSGGEIVFEEDIEE